MTKRNEKKVIALDIECESCDGTGLYVGFGEKSGAAVVCATCKGTGIELYRFEYKEFCGRKRRKGVKRVFQANPGIGVTEDKEKNLSLSDFGGIPYKDWEEGKPFPSGSEMRKFTCPAWWFQAADFKKKPHWKECLSAFSFPGCKYFPDKEKCWERYDRESSKK